MFASSCNMWLLLICLPPVLSSMYPSSSMAINRGEGFVARLNLEGSSSISECTLIYDTTNSYQLIPVPSTSHVTPTFETIEPLSGSECGARVKNVSSLSPEVWRFQAELPNDSIISDSIKLSILNSITDPEIITVSGVAGQFGTITCPGEESEQRYCEIIDPLSKTTQSCNLKVKYPPVAAEANQFVCHVWFWGRLDVVRTEIHVSSHESSPKVVSRMIENNSDHVILSCQILEEKLSVCRAEISQTQFLIMDGFQGRRYSARDTLLANGLCQFEIEKPLAANETGVWRIHAKLSSSNRWTGCVFDLAHDPDEEYETFKSSLESVISLQSTADTFDLSCGGGPYPLDYCYLKTPSNSVVQPSVNEMKFFNQYGICTFTINPATGRYTCGFNSRDHTGDLYQHYDMKRVDSSKYGDTSSPEVHVGPSNRLTLLCYTLQDYSINSCIFVAPNGELYHLLNSSYSNGRFGYYGKGFVDGECGIEIYKVDYGSHIGNWECNMNLIDRGQVSMTILVKGNELSAASVVGIALGGAVVLVIAAFGFIYYRRRSRSTASRESESAAGENIPL